MIWRTLLRMLPGLGMMAFIVVLFIGKVDWLTPGPFGARFALVAGTVAAGGLVYFASLWLFGVHEMRQAWTMAIDRLARRFRKVD